MVDDRKYITEEKAEEIALAVADGNVIKSKLKSSNYPEYRFEIMKDGFKHKISVDADNGKIKRHKIDYLERKFRNRDNSKTIISQDDARRIALEKVDGKIMEIELGYKRDKSAEYEVEIAKDGVEHEVEIDAYTGKIKEYEIDYTKNTEAYEHVNTEREVIPQEQAIETALKEVDGEVIEVELEYELDGTIEYEVEIIKDDVIHEVEIDALTGDVLDVEIDD